jgi:NADH-quinone oxidoreductase subunit N
MTATLLGGEAGLRSDDLNAQAAVLMWIMALASMCIGNLLGLLQDNLRRLLAYSSIAHAGYMLAGLGAGTSTIVHVSGVEAVLFYLVVYGAMTIGVFAVIAYLSRSERPVESIDDLAGLGRSHPVAALLMTVFLFSLTGLPPTAGFLAKLYVFLAAWETQSPLYQFLAVAMALNAAIGAWYYLRIVTSMYLRQAVKELDHRTDRPGLIAIVLCAVFTLGLFFFPKTVWREVEKAAVFKSTAMKHDTPASGVALRE